MTINQEYDKRIKEIDVYFSILEHVELDKPKLIGYDALLESEKVITFDNSKINILRASVFLMLYNLIESTVFNSIIAVFDDINSLKHKPKLKYFDVIDEIKKFWLHNIYKHDEKIKKDTLIDFFFEISNRIFNESIVLATNYFKYSGSLDCAKIKNTAISLGVNTRNLSSGFREDTHGEAFTQIKNNRNWLAHGEKSFADIGQDFPVNILMEYKVYINEHLKKYILSIQQYIENEEYKVIK